MNAITRLSLAAWAYPSVAPTAHPIEPYCIWNSYLLFKVIILYLVTERSKIQSISNDDQWRFRKKGIPASLGELELLAVEPRVTGLSNNRGVTGQHLLDVLEEDVHPERLVGLAVGRVAVGHEDPFVVVVRRGVGLQPLAERAEELGHEDAPEGRAVADHHAVGLHDHGLLPLEQQRVPHGAVVVEDGAREEVRVRGLDDLRAERGAHRAPVRADEPRVVLRNQALACRHHREGVPAGVSDRGEGLLRLGGADLRPSHHDRLHGLVQELGRGLDCVLQVHLVAHPDRRWNGTRRDVAFIAFLLETGQHRKIQ
jgi:hypothetical protein